MWVYLYLLLEKGLLIYVLYCSNLGLTWGVSCELMGMDGLLTSPYDHHKHLSFVPVPSSGMGMDRTCTHNIDIITNFSSPYLQFWHGHGLWRGDVRVGG